MTVRVALALSLLFGCDPAAEDPCIEAYAAPQCTPLYEPTFENFHRETLLKSCAVTGGCHNSETAASGLVYTDPDVAYASLIDRGLAIPHQPECSPLVHRLMASDPARTMPPRRPLSAAEQCVAQLWIEYGAQR